MVYNQHPAPSESGHSHQTNPYITYEDFAKAQLEKEGRKLAIAEYIRGARSVASEQTIANIEQAMTDMRIDIKQVAALPLHKLDNLWPFDSHLARDFKAHLQSRPRKAAESTKCSYVLLTMCSDKGELRPNMGPAKPGSDGVNSLCTAIIEAMEAGTTQRGLEHIDWMRCESAKARGFGLDVPLYFDQYLDVGTPPVDQPLANEMVTLDESIDVNETPSAYQAHYLNPAPADQAHYFNPASANQAHFFNPTSASASASAPVPSDEAVFFNETPSLDQPQFSVPALTNPIVFEQPCPIDPALIDPAFLRCSIEELDAKWFALRREEAE